MPQIITVACFGLPGFGNDLLEILYEFVANSADRNTQVEIVGLHTRKHQSDCVYYACQALEILANKMAVQIHYIPPKGNWDCTPADLAIVSTFHRIFKTKHLAKFKRVINIHPSLLPSYQGATPTHWMIRNNENIVGVSAHLMDEKIDCGPIIFQRKMLNPRLNDNQLRKALSFLSRDIIRDIINDYPDYKFINPLSDSSHQSARSINDATLKLSDITDINALVSHIQCYTNHPMPRLQVDNSIFIIDFNKPSVTLNITVASESFALMGYWE